MAQYRKKPVVIEAEVYRKGLEDGFDCPRLECEYGGKKNCKNQCGVGKPYIKTLEGYHRITEGDYIITGVKGERYPCKPDIFKMTYEKVN